MSYLTDAVTEVDVTAVENGAYLHVQETDVVSLSGRWDAKEYAERFYKRDGLYDGPIHSVAEERDDGYAVMIMEDG